MTGIMPALVNYGREPFSVELREVPVPEIGERDVLLRVGAVSVCGSDLHQWRGSASWHVNYPCILGHEFAGTIAQTGARVSNFKEGERVVSETAAVIDESSPLSRTGLYNLDPDAPRLRLWCRRRDDPLCTGSGALSSSHSRTPQFSQGCSDGTLLRCL